MSRISFALSSSRGHLRGSRFLAFSAVLTFALVGHLALASGARAAGGSALGWGYNNEGQLGAPSGTEVTTPRFRVRALDILGADAKPANRKFKVRAVRRKRRRAPSR